MGDKTKIQWTDATWNPTLGCTRVSPGCQHCYAERMAQRQVAMGTAGYEGTVDEHGRWTGKLNCLPDRLDQPLRWKRPRMIFVNSMSDLFHEDVAEKFIGRVFEVMIKAHWHKFQVLTKRSDLMASVVGRHIIKPPKNVWLGTSVENADYAHRIGHLRRTPAAVRFLSLEPLLGPLPNLNLYGIDWVIVGGESGPGARPMHPDWARDIRDQCAGAGVPFFFKQVGGVNKKEAGRLLDGRTWDEMPEVKT
tara:strand:- start:2658 stop:3404 length:747 start_codon:yes stop_codon:yes gene_type:complete